MNQKYIKELTDKQRKAMPAYTKKWIKIGLKTGEADWKTFDKYMPICYTKAGIIYPKNIVRVQSPMVGALAAAVAEALLRARRGDAVRGAVSDAVDGAVDGAVSDAVRGAVSDAVRGAVSDAVDGAVDGAVSDAVDGAVRGAVDGAVRGAVDGAVRDAVDGAVRDAVDGAVGDAVDGAVGDAVDGAVSDAVDGAVDGAVRGAVDGAVRDAVDGAVRDAVDGAVDGAVRGAVDGAVRDAVDGAVRDAVDGAVSDAVQTAISIAKKASVSFSWHYWLGGQFWVGYGYYSWSWLGVAAVNFFFDICKLKLSKDIMERALAYRKVCESVNYIWLNRDFVMVCARPVHIDKDESGRLHSQTRMAIQYPDGWGLYRYHGIEVPEKWILHSEKLTKEDWLNEVNLEKRRVIQELMGEKFPKKIGAKLIAKPSKEFKKHNLLGLYEVELKDDPERVARYVKVRDHSSKREYFLRVKPTINDADEALAFTFGMTKEEYNPIQEA
jgi:hypothetical protein